MKGLPGRVWRVWACTGMIAAMATFGCSREAAAPSESPSAPKAPPVSTGTDEPRPAESEPAVTFDFGPAAERFVCEAEAGEVAPPMQVFPDEAASNKQYVMTPEPPNDISQAKGGHVTFAFDIKKPGKYNLWLRVYWSSSCDNSFDVSLNAGPKIEVTSNTYHAWRWEHVGHKPFVLPAGPALVTVHSREDGSKLDQVLLIEVPDDQSQPYVPVGVETSGPRSRGQAPTGLETER